MEGDSNSNLSKLNLLQPQTFPHVLNTVLMVKQHFLSSNKIAWNLFELTIILLSLNQFIEQALSDSIKVTRSFTVLEKHDKVLSSAEL